MAVPRSLAQPSSQPVLSPDGSSSASALMSVTNSAAGSNPTRSIIQRLRSAIIQQEATLRNLREPLSVPAAPSRTGGYSTVASSHNASSVATPSQFHVASRRRWCAEFQYVCEKAMRNAQNPFLAASSATNLLEKRFADVNACLMEFEAEAGSIAQSFLERYLGDDAEMSSASSLGGSASTERGTSPPPPQQQQQQQAVYAVYGTHRTNSGDPSPSASQCQQDGIGGGVATHSPQSAGTRGGRIPCEWATAAQLQQGSFLTITVLDCEDNAAAASVAKEQRSHMLLLAVQMLCLPRILVHVAPRCVVQLRGRALLVAAQSLVGGEPLKVTECEALRLALSFATDAMHLGRYFAPKDDEDGSEEVFTCGHPTAQTRLGTDGRFYVVGLRSLFPHFPPARGASITKRHKLFLREEFIVHLGTSGGASETPTSPNHSNMSLRSRNTSSLLNSSRTSTEATPRQNAIGGSRLSPGAFLVYGSRDSTAQNTRARECSQVLCQQLVQQVAASLVESYGRQLQACGSLAAMDHRWLSQQLHAAGVNIGFLALVLGYVTGPCVTLIFSEMLARVARDHLRSRMCRRVDIDDITRAVSEFFAEISRPETFTALWQDELFQRVAQKFAGYGSLFPEHATQVPYVWLDKGYVLKRVSQCLGIEFAAGVTGDGPSAFHYPVKAMYAVVASFPLVVPLSLRWLTTHAAVDAVAHHSSASAPASWFPPHLAERATLLRCVAAAGGPASPSRPPSATMLDDVAAWLSSYARFMRQTYAPLSGGQLAIQSSTEMAMLQLDAASALTNAAAASSTPPRADWMEAAVGYSRSSAQLVSKANGHDEGLLLTMVQMQQGRCSLLTGDVSEGIRLLDAAFHTASSIGNRRTGTGTPRAATVATGTGTGYSSAAVRSATSSVEVQALSLPSGCMSPPQLLPAVRAPSAGNQRATKISILDEWSGPPTSTNASAAAVVGVITNTNNNSLSQHQSPPQSEAGGIVTWDRTYVPPAATSSAAASEYGDFRNLNRSNDMLSVSDMDGGVDGGGATSKWAGGVGGSRATQFTALAAECATMLAEVLEEHGRHQEAEAVYRYSLGAAMALYGPVHPAVTAATTSLGVNLFQQQRFVEAEALFREDLRISELLYGLVHPNVSGSLNNLACLLDAVGRSEESEAMFLRDLSITKGTLGPDSEEVATSENNLGTTYLRRGLLESADTMLSDALRIRIQRCGESGGPVAESLFNLGAVKRQRGDPSAARNLWERCLHVQQQTYGEMSEKLLPVLEVLCVVLEEQGDYERSEHIMELAFQVKQLQSQNQLPRVL